MTEPINKKPTKSVKFVEPISLFHTLTDEFIIEIGKYLLPNTTLPVPSFKPHYQNYKHAFDTRSDYTDYLSFRKTCHKTSYLLRPIKKDLEVEIKSRESFDKWCNAPEDVLKNIIRLRLNFTLSPKDDIPTTSAALWTEFISLLKRLLNLIELYLTSTPFCWHGKTGQTMLFDLPEPNIFPSILTFANEVKCRCCAEHLTRLINSMSNLEHLKCTSEDSVSQVDLDEEPPYDLFINLPNLPSLKSFYLKYWELDTFDGIPVQEINDALPNLKKLVYSSHNPTMPFALHQRLKIEALENPNRADHWGFMIDREEGSYISVGGPLQIFATDWSMFNKMEEFDPGFVLNLSQYDIETYYGDGPRRGELPYEDTGDTSAGSSVPFPIKVVHPDEYQRIFKVVMVKATELMKNNWPSLKRVIWWQDRNKRIDSPTRDYLKWTAIVTDDTPAEPAQQEDGQEGNDRPSVKVTIQGPEIMNHDLTWSDEGTVPPDVEDPCDKRVLAKRAPEDQILEIDGGVDLM